MITLTLDLLPISTSSIEDYPIKLNEENAKNWNKDRTDPSFPASAQANTNI